MMWNTVVKIVLRKSWEMGWHEGYGRGWKDCEEQAVKAIVNESEWIKAVATTEDKVKKPKGNDTANSWGARLL